MILSYSERKEAVQDDFESFHNEVGYSIKETLYATIGESEHIKDYTQIDKACIYLNFALILLRVGEDIGFMKDKLIELSDDRQIDLYKADLGNEFQEFLNDVNIIKCHL